MMASQQHGIEIALLANSGVQRAVQAKARAFSLLVRTSIFARTMDQNANPEIDKHQSTF
jgi:hypothetical protein